MASKKRARQEQSNDAQEAQEAQQPVVNNVQQMNQVVNNAQQVNPQQVNQALVNNNAQQVNQVVHQQASLNSLGSFVPHADSSNSQDDDDEDAAVTELDPEEVFARALDRFFIDKPKLKSYELRNILHSQYELYLPQGSRMADIIKLIKDLAWLRKLLPKRHIPDQIDHAERIARPTSLVE